MKGAVMLQTEIRRDAIILPCEPTGEIGTLAGDAEKVLGYSVLRESIDEPPETPRLAHALGQLGIDILNKQDVITYMSERLCNRTLELLGEWSQRKPAVSDWGSGEYFMGPSWESTPIAKYKEAIPEFVINKAVQIKQALPECQIWIRHLTEDRDPFLEVTLGKANEYNSGKNGSERYFIEVWDEPKFEGRLR